MRSTLERALASWRRDAAAGVRSSTRVRKALEYVAGIAICPLALRHVDEVGRGVRIIGWPRIDNEGFMRIGAGTVLRGTTIPVELGTGPGARLEIGAEVSINSGVSVGCLGHVRIGDRCRLGPQVLIIDSDFHEAYDRSRVPAPRPVVLGDDVWVGAKACVMPGVTVGRGAIIGAAAVVTHEVPPFAVVAGVPARVVRMLDPARFVAAIAS